MSSETKCASSVIKNEQPLADCVHCRNHCINLVIAFACKSTSVTNFMDSLTSVCYYFANSPKRQQYFERFIDYYKDELSVVASSRSHVIGSSKTHCVERYTYFLSLLLQRLTSFVIHICTKISISTWKMKLSKIGVGTVNLSTKHKVYLQFVPNLTRLLLFQCCFTV